MMGGLFSSFRAVFRPNSNRNCRRSRGSLRGSSSCQPKPPSRSNYSDFDAYSRVLTIRGIDAKIPENARNHRTDRYELVTRDIDPKLVVRRGQGFFINLSLSRSYDSDRDAISLVFTFAGAEKPNRGQKTLLAIPLLPKGEKSCCTWSAELESSYEKYMTIWITTSSDALIGEWKMDIDTKLKNGNAVSYNYNSTFFLLFNPWHRDDQVYMEGESYRQEYVLSETGLVWRGTVNRLRPSVWKYAQFERDILECSLYLISKVGKVGIRSLGDAVTIARSLSAAVNSPDDYGAVLGNWTNDFGGGTPPTKWLGSMKILQQYWKTKKPVKYGQCWVFAGVLTTIARAIGIPSRIVTNYCSAHDTQNSLTVDYFVDEDGEIMEELNSDSVWNYHVWNEVWMSRPDLSDRGEYDGWQAVDATPQELSNDMYRCGPASVAAVKRGEVLRPYDSAFLYSEVNADKVFWKYSGPTQPLKLLRKDVTGIGQLMSTKAVGKWTREDITKSYKYPEESEEERDAMLQALRQSESLFSRYYLNEDFNDIHFDFALRDDIIIGSPFTVVVVMRNRSRSKDHKVILSLRVDAVTYRGKIGDSVKKEKFELLIKAGKVEEAKMSVTYEEYSKRLLDQCDFNIACLATVVDTNFEYFAQDDFRVRKPDIKIQGNLVTHGFLCVTAKSVALVPQEFVKTLKRTLLSKACGCFRDDAEDKTLVTFDFAAATLKSLFLQMRLADVYQIKIEGEPVENVESKVYAYFTNPLPVPLKKGEFRIEGPGLPKQLKIKLREAVEPGEEARVSFMFRPIRSGRHEIVAKFLSKELDDVDGFLVFMVSDNKDRLNGNFLY